MLYAFLPLIWLPAGVGAYLALGRSHPGAMLLALVLAALFDGLNLYLGNYLGNYLGEFLGELSFSTILLLTSWALRRSQATRPWIAGVGLLTGAAGLVGMFRNVTAAVAPVAAVNYLLPLGMIVLGVVLYRHRTVELPITDA